MFDIFFKRKKIVLDCFTANVNAFDLFPVQSAKQFYPSWWRNLPKTQVAEGKNGLAVERPTMKSCSGLLNLYQAGVIIPLWSDVVVQTRGLNYVFTFADGVSALPYHDLEDLGIEFQNYLNVKFDSPWRIREKSGIKFAMIQPSWSNPAELFTSHALPGVVEFKYQHTTNINMFLSRSRRYEWQAGRAMAQIIPLTEHEVEIKTHLVTQADLESRKIFNQSSPFFQGAYKKIKNINEGKCPF